MAAANNKLNMEEWPSWGSRSVECFEKLEQIGEGTYGQVYMAREKKTGEIVALKKIRMDNEKEGFPITAIREIKILKKLQHENVINLKEIVTSPGREGNEQGKPDGNKYQGNIYMVFEYMDHDLTGLADRPGLRFTVPQIKCYMKQLLTGLHYCHVNQVLHRDIKGSNLLIDNEGNLKLADFGLARSFSNDVNANLTNRVITLWYRPPELLLGATKYGPAVDMWSVGCIFAELLYGKPILPGKNETEQLNKIFELCGTPDELTWPGVSKIPWYNRFKPTIKMKKRTRELFRHFDRHALDLLDKMLVLDPAQRISAKDALDAEYFWTDPLPCDPKSLPKYEASHEFQTKKKRQQQRQNEEIAKRQKLQHPQQHARLPPIQQTGQTHPQHWNNPSQQINNPQPPMPGVTSHHQYGKPRGPPGGGGPGSRYPPGGVPAASGGYYQDRGGQSGGGYSNNNGPYPSQGRGPPPYPGNSAPSNSGPRGNAVGYGAPPAPPPSNYSQSSQYGASGGRGGQNPPGGNRNQQYGWQQ
ncbi:Cyclin-dependent kinase C-1 [Orobanche minor]